MTMKGKHRQLTRMTIEMLNSDEGERCLLDNARPTTGLSYYAVLYGDLRFRALWRQSAFLRKGKRAPRCKFNFPLGEVESDHYLTSFSRTRPEMSGSVKERLWGDLRLSPAHYYVYLYPPYPRDIR